MSNSQPPGPVSGEALAEKLTAQLEYLYAIRRIAAELMAIHERRRRELLADGHGLPLFDYNRTYGRGTVALKAKRAGS